MTVAHSNNFCSGSCYQDWLEVNLLSTCNGRCSWCINKNSYTPTKSVSIDILCKAAIDSGKKNVILLGGEPTLHPYLEEIISTLATSDLNVYLTTNGSILTKDYVKDTLKGLKGINISVHHYSPYINSKITGLLLDYKVLQSSIQQLQLQNTSVRLNCNIIKGYIDTYPSIKHYLRFVKGMDVFDVRFAELKNDIQNFIGLETIFGKGVYGLNDDPFTQGCVKTGYMNGIFCSFRQMCGVQNPLRPLPIAPEQVQKDVLYYDGNIYKGWQISLKERKDMDEKLLTLILEKVKSGELTIEEAKKAFVVHEKEMLKATQGNHKPQQSASGFGCVY